MFQILTRDSFFEGFLVIQFITVYFFFIETRGATLEEISKTFDGAEAVDEFKAKAQDAIGVSDLTEIGDGKKGRSTGFDHGSVEHVDEIHQVNKE